jgi:hypothetical protein
MYSLISLDDTSIQYSVFVELSLWVCGSMVAFFFGCVTSFSFSLMILLSQCTRRIFATQRMCPFESSRRSHDTKHTNRFRLQTGKSYFNFRQTTSHHFDGFHQSIGECVSVRREPLPPGPGGWSCSHQL